MSAASQNNNTSQVNSNAKKAKGKSNAVNHSNPALDAEDEIENVSTTTGASGGLSGVSSAWRERVDLGKIHAELARAARARMLEGWEKTTRDHVLCA